MVMVDGKIVVENGVVQTVDADAIRARAAVIGAALMEA